MEPLVPVTFEPERATSWVERGSTVLKAAQQADVVIDAECGGRGTCGSCGVRVMGAGLRPPDAQETAVLGSAPSDVRLACLARVTGPVTVRPLARVQLERQFPVLAPDSTELVAGVDLGTTTVAAVVVDRATGLEVGRSVVANRQASFGADVLSRITAAISGGAAQLRESAESSVVEAILAAGGAENAARIQRVVVAGNTVMMALLAAADVSSLAVHPFDVPAGCCGVMPGGALEAAVAPGAHIEVVQPIAGFVGGDLVAGVYALGLIDGPPRLLVDVGTNAEVALAVDGVLWVASAAAGPAFEGGGISSGGRAAPGAVTSVAVSESGEVELETMGDSGPSWFSGAGLISAMAALMRTGHLDVSGRMIADGPLSTRFSRDEAGVLGVYFGDRPGRLTVTQLDIRALQLAKAAVCVAIRSVLSAARVQVADIEVVYVAGAFGNALSETDIIELGLVPREAAGKVVAAGNTSVAGAVGLAISLEPKEEVDRVLRAAHHLDLAGTDDFNAALMAAVALEPYSA